MRIWFILLLLQGYLLANAHIFVYHRFGDSKHASTNTSIEELRKEFEYFKNHGYQVVPLTTLVELMHAKKPIPDNYVALTIDDSYKSFYENGLALFREYNYPFTLFVYMEASKRKYGDFMSFDQLREVSQYGELGLHSYGHPHLTKIGSEEVVADTKKGYELFKKEFGYAPKGYAYPYGEFNESVKEQIKSFGFEYICNQNSGAVESFTSPYDITRIALVGEVKLKSKLRIKALDVKWEDILIEDNHIKAIQLKTEPTLKKAQLYISGHGWQRVKLLNGELNLKLDKIVKFNRTRLILKSYDHRQSSKLLIK
jgi:peptidoglycan/xylan/chitin deacetylase (PgdA/CDA1 family)